MATLRKSGSGLPFIPPELYPFESNFLKLGDWRYHYVDEGRGEPVIMVHGNPTWSFYFRKLIKALRPSHRVIAPDHIGCGFSDKPPAAAYGYRLEDRVDDLEALLDHLNLTAKLTLVVHDWGGMIALAFALRHPERIGRLVILNTAAFLPPKGKRLPFSLRVIRKLPLPATVALCGFNLFARAALVMASKKRLAAEVRSGLIAPYNSWNNRIATLKFVQDIPVSPKDPSYAIVAAADRHLNRLAHAPMLICWGARDFVFDRDYLEEWRRRFPEARVFVYENAGHYVLEDAGDEIILRVQEFLSQVPL